MGNSIIGEVKEVHTNGRAATFEWSFPHFRYERFPHLEDETYQSPTVTYFNMEWWLQINTSWHGIDSICLKRKLLTPGIPEPVHFSMQCKISYSEERDVARKQTILDQAMWDLQFYGPWRIPCNPGFTVTCSLWQGDSPSEPDVSLDTGTEDASCSKSRIDEHMNPGSKGVSRETQTEVAGSRNDEHPLEGVSRQTQTEDVHGRNDGHPLEGASRERQTEDCEGRSDEHHSKGPLSLYAPKVPVAWPAVTRLNTRNPDRSMGNVVVGEVKEVHRNGRAATFEWSFPNFQFDSFPYLKIGTYQSPRVMYLNTQWWLEINTSGFGINYVALNRRLLTPGIPEPVHFNLHCKISYSEERDVAKEETIRDRDRWFLCFDHPWTILPSPGFTLTCSLWRCDSPHAPGVSRDTRTEGASCSKCRIDEHMSPGSKGVSRSTQTEDAGSRNDDHPLEGVSRQTQTEDVHGRNDGHPLEGMEELREEFRLWRERPQDGHRIRILRMEHFQKRPSSSP